jgi:predicted  nucleic acid-binding Zn-ribbon protein
MSSLQEVFDQQLDSAFEALLDMADAVLASPDDLLESNPSVLAKIRITKDRYNELLTQSERILSELGNETSDVLAEESGVYNLIQEMKSRVNDFEPQLWHERQNRSKMHAELSEAGTQLNRSARILQDKIDEYDVSIHFSSKEHTIVSDYLFNIGLFLVPHPRQRRDS